MPLDGSTFYKQEPEGLKNLRRLLVVMEMAPSRAVNLNVTDCGSAACVYGWARRDPVLCARGMPTSLWTHAMYEGTFANFLGVTSEEARDLTDPNLYPNAVGSRAKVEAIKRIRALIAKYAEIHAKNTELVK